MSVSNTVRNLLVNVDCKALVFGTIVAMSIVGAPVHAQEKVLHLGISKNVAGSVTEGKTTSWKVKRDNKQVEMFTVVAEGTLAVTSGDPNDDDLPKAFNGYFKVHFDLTGRTGTASFGTLAAKYTWTDGTNTVEGYMVGVFGCNPVRKPLVDITKDTSPGVFNGTLTGDITAGPMKGQKIQAGFLGKLIIPNPSSASAITARVYMTLDGVHIVPSTLAK